MKAKFTISVEIPDGVSKKEMRDYIYDAVNGMKGSYHPDDPLFQMDYGDFKVSHQKIKPRTPPEYNADHDPNYSPAMMAR